MIKIYPSVELQKIKLCWINGFHRIVNMRQVTQSGMKSSPDEFKAIYKDRISIKMDSWPEEAITEVADNIAESALAEAELTADAASLVFAHSMLEAAVVGYLTVTYMFLPEIWEDYARNHQVTLNVSQLRKINVEELIAKETKIKLDRFCGESLPNKVTRLEYICQSIQPLQIDGFRFDPARLKRLDMERHSVVHGKDLRLQPRQENAEDDLQFLYKTAQYCHILVSKKLGVFKED